MLIENGCSSSISKALPFWTRRYSPSLLAIFRFQLCGFLSIGRTLSPNSSLREEWVRIVGGKISLWAMSGMQRTNGHNTPLLTFHDPINAAARKKFQKGILRDFFLWEMFWQIPKLFSSGLSQIEKGVRDVANQHLTCIKICVNL